MSSLSSAAQSQPPAVQLGDLPRKAGEQAPGGGQRCLQVEHVTQIRYSTPVEEAQHVACLKPVSDARQTLLAHHLTVDPEPAYRAEQFDAFGNARQFLSGFAPHRVLRLTANSQVHLHLPAPAEPGASLPWEQVSTRLAYRAGAPFEPAAEFAQASPRVPKAAALRAWALQDFTPDRPLAEAAVALMARLYAEFEFDPQATEVNTPLMSAFDKRRGVCQDFSHILLGALRSLGLAARYVSGYLLTTAPAGGVRLQGADASHAWVAVWCPALPGATSALCRDAWLDLDPTNNCIPGLSHVRLAHGRDYDDVSPWRGVIRGGGGHEVSVHVTTTELPGPAAGTEFAYPD